MPLVELVIGEQTSEETADRGRAFSEAIARRSSSAIRT